VFRVFLLRLKDTNQQLITVYITTCCWRLACDLLQNEWPRMTLSGYFT